MNLVHSTLPCYYGHMHSRKRRRAHLLQLRVQVGSWNPETEAEERKKATGSAGQQKGVKKEKQIQGTKPTGPKWPYYMNRLQITTSLYHGAS